MKLIENRKFKGVWIPKEIWFDRSLPLLSRIFMVEIDYLETTEDRGCYASNKYFSEFFGLSTGRCSNVINDLKRKEFIEIKYKYEGKEIKERNIFLTEKGIKYMQGGISKKKGGISKTLKRDNNTNIVSKDTIAVFEKKLSRHSKFIEKWNTYPNTTTHKISNTKTIQKLIKYFTLLKSGNFHKTCDLNFQFATKNNIKLNNFVKFTDEEIFTAMENVSKYYLEGYSPQNKSHLPKDLPSLIFNPRTGSSLFLAAFFNPPKPIRKKEVQNKYSKAVDKYLILFPVTAIDFRLKNKVTWNVNDIMDWHQKKCKRLGKYLGHTNFSDYIAGDNFIQTHISWIRKEIQDMNIHVLDMNTQYWKSFIKWLKEFHGINLEPTREEYRQMKFNYENAKRFHKETMSKTQVTADMI